MTQLGLSHLMIWQLSQRKQHVSSYIGNVQISTAEFAQEHESHITYSHFFPLNRKRFTSKRQRDLRKCSLLKPQNSKVFLGTL